MSLRELLVDWLTSSRYISSLERIHAEQREDCVARLADKDAQIKALRLELALVKNENEKMRLVLMPLGSAAGKTFAAKFGAAANGQSDRSFVAMGSAREKAARSTPLDWQGELNQMLQEEEDGIQGKRRTEVHEQAANDGAQPLAGA